MTFAAYIAAVIAANLLTAHYAPADIGPFLVTWGTWMIGATFILRDLLQRAHGRTVAYIAIATGLAASAATSRALEDPLWITAASAAAFAISETADTETYTRIRARLSTRIAASGAVAVPLDTIVFATIGLSPLTTGYVPWASMPNLILGQLLIKGALQAGAAAIARLTEPGPEGEPA